MGDNNDNVFIDSISITTAGSSQGYWNGDDASNDCGAAVKREREIDKLTWDAA